MQRRDFLRYLGASAALGLVSPWADVWAAGAPTMPGNTGANGRVVVIGGGMAGATVAKYLRFWGGTGVSVTLVEPNPTYYSNIFSNMILTGEKTRTQLGFSYGALASKYGVKLVTKAVKGIESTYVVLDDGNKLPFDRLVIAPGISFDSLPLSGAASAQDKIVHAWNGFSKTAAGTYQIDALQAQIKAMTSKDTFILSIPPKPYRCPPGPYERACVVADYLNRTKAGAKVIVLDANANIQAEPNNFTKAFASLGVKYVPNAQVSSIDADKGIVNTVSAGSFAGKVINAIPPQKAASLILNSSGLANYANRWAAVDVKTYESTAAPNIHVIGDACATTQPKAGHIANAEAKVCADAIVHLLRGEAVNPVPFTNSACFTPTKKGVASWLSVAFRYDPAVIDPITGKLGAMAAVGGVATESSGATAENYEEMLTWFKNLMADTFA